jgi:hypothetical protein
MLANIALPEIYINLSDLCVATVQQTQKLVSERVAKTSDFH